MDVKLAYLHGVLEEEIYMEQLVEQWESHRKGERKKRK